MSLHEPVQHGPAPTWTPRRFVGLGAALLTLLVGITITWTALFDDGTGRIDSLLLDAPGSPQESCVYDDEAEQMVVHTRLRARTTGPVEVVIELAVTHADTGEEGATAEEAVIVDGAHNNRHETRVDLPRRKYDDGFTRCFFGVRTDRAEFWD